MKSKIYKGIKEGSKRVIIKYAWFPVFIGDRIEYRYIWLEKYKEHQMYMWVRTSYLLNSGHYRWQFQRNEIIE